jgi:mono/diheme cytochrome c family protein
MKFLALALVLTTAAAAEEPAGVVSAQRAKMNWMLNCQGCHRPDATGSEGGAPAMAHEVARFLTVDGGREFLTRVPGVTNAGLDNAQLAELLNWTLATFDSEHVPADFEPFTPEEIAAGRAHPLVSDAARMREALIGKFTADQPMTAGGE